MRLLLILAIAGTLLHGATAAATAVEEKAHHKRHGHKHHRSHSKLHRRHKRRHQRADSNSTANSTANLTEPNGTNATESSVENRTEAEKKDPGPKTTKEDEIKIIHKMKVLEKDLAKQAAKAKEAGAPKVAVVVRRGLEVNGPLPPDFDTIFSDAVSEATGADEAQVKVVKARARADGTFRIIFQAPPDVADSTQEQAADPDSKLANGPLHNFLVAKEPTKKVEEVPPVEEKDEDEADEQEGKQQEKKKETIEEEEKEEKEEEEEEKPEKKKKRETAEEEEEEEEDKPRTVRHHRKPPVQVEEEEQDKDIDQAAIPMQRGLDVDAALPYGELEPFGREDTAQELTERSIAESNQMVDQLERAEVAEEKRAVFRALTRLRGAALTAFDGIARAQTGTIDQYNKLHKWRNAHPLHHLADDEADVSKWAFPGPQEED